MVTIKKLLCVALLCLAGCSRPTATASKPVASTEPTGPSVYIFWTGESPPGELSFAVREKELYLEVTEKDGKVKLYHCPKLPDETLSKIAPFFEAQQTAFRMEGGGEIKSNGAIALTRHVVMFNVQNVEYWGSFVADDSLNNMLAAVRSAGIKPEQVVEKPPAWVAGESRIGADFATTRKTRDIPPP